MCFGIWLSALGCIYCDCVLMCGCTRVFLSCVLFPCFCVCLCVGACVFAFVSLGWFDLSVLVFCVVVCLCVFLSVFYVGCACILRLFVWVGLL